ncbi:NnrU family protein [Pseudophaeobacter sp.]|uniref:NnrU family protein n=1 Tax=Pseudophaeobacter sp. TaxID=1971739 RepID=UPI003297FA09
MSDWLGFALSLSAFLASHIIPRIGGMRDKLIQKLGRRLYFSLYGALSLVLFAWLIVQVSEAPRLEIWPQQAWMRWLPNLAMPLAFVLIFCGLGLRNAHTLGGTQKSQFTSVDPGIAAVSRHPLLMALLIWAATHFVVNGDLAHVLMFGSFASFSLIAMWAFDKKAAREMGDHAEAFFAKTAWLSLTPLLQKTWLHRNLRDLAPRCVLGLLCWASLLPLHEAIIGVWPFPL